MSASFKNILVPVDFTINTEVAINKAMEVAGKEGSTIHLLYILTHLLHNLLPVNLKKNSTEYASTDQAVAITMLTQWKDSIKKVAPSIDVQICIIPDVSIQANVSKKAIEIKADLIIIGKKSNYTWFQFLNKVLSSELAEATGCPVLTVKPGAMYTKIKTIVVSVTEDVPQHKMEAIEILCKKFRAKVHLVSFTNVPANFSASSLLKLYQWLKNTLHCPVECIVLPGYNRPRALLKYTEKIEADILLVNPKTETKMGWMNRHISDALPAHSKVQVLAM